jgi:hypothetical protein
MNMLSNGVPGSIANNRWRPRQLTPITSQLLLLTGKVSALVMRYGLEDAEYLPESVDYSTFMARQHLLEISSGTLGNHLSSLKGMPINSD